jgi:hypothetical protein
LQQESTKKSDHFGSQIRKPFFFCPVEKMIFHLKGMAELGVREPVTKPAAASRGKALDTWSGSGLHVAHAASNPLFLLF